MKKSKLFSLIALLLTAVLLLTACGSNNTANNAANSGNSAQSDTQNAAQDDTAAEPVTITYCNFNSSGGNEETLAKMVEAFESEYPNITVEVETIGFDDYFTQMQTRVAGGTAPKRGQLLHADGRTYRIVAH